MNDLNLPENTLRSWRPRRPAAGPKRRIFETATEPALPAIRWLWGSLAPAAACAFMALTTMHRDTGSLLAAGRDTNLFIGGQQLIISHPKTGQSAQNHLAGVTFDWTNRSLFKSSMAFALSNNLTQ
jgi:hypothetical protein